MDTTNNHMDTTNNHMDTSNNTPPIAPVGTNNNNLTQTTRRVTRSMSRNINKQGQDNVEQEPNTVEKKPNTVFTGVKTRSMKRKQSPPEEPEGRVTRSMSNKRRKGPGPIKGGKRNKTHKKRNKKKWSW